MTSGREAGIRVLLQETVPADLLSRRTD